MMGSEDAALVGVVLTTEELVALQVSGGGRWGSWLQISLQSCSWHPCILEEFLISAGPVESAQFWQCSTNMCQLWAVSC
jgi:hypothetical protein